ncbi:MAG: CRISPR-associated helicase Cas3' [Methanofollis sp.]|uniref:CRISPR-associated helicase Cas3' n=1 Tax=Methanofollis sp. TaxID=2052835 RepID=UPI002619D8F8|nr:CRISPR-associated helicase Cas3' [Methanofollis sp.]MDD4254284.1 CRISPR-associated helicase Cas3' [Methanofollis sp.]
MSLAHYDSKTNREQTLLEHGSTVSTLCKTYGGVIGCPHLAELCGRIHDAGKAKQEFQAYLRSGDKHLRGKINHTSAGARYIFEKYGKSTDVYQVCTAQLISLAVCSHHSGLIDCIDTNGLDRFHSRLYPDKDIGYDESITNLETECITTENLDALFHKAVEETRQILEPILRRQDINQEKPFHFALFARYLLSCVIDADRYDTYCFKAGLQTQDPDYELETTWQELADNLEQYLSTEMRKDREIDRLRAEISDTCRRVAVHPGGIYRLCVPTGGGKTLASLRYALRHADLHKKRRIIYAIPFTTIIDQNADVVHKSLKKDRVILEHHSNLIQDPEEDKIQDPKKDTLTELDEGDRRSLLTERWDAPIILTTTVQFLNTLFLGKTQCVRRMHNLANSIIIFDEVQTIPIKCLDMFNAALNFLAEICGATIILCTATQPGSNVGVPVRCSSPENLVPDYEGMFGKFRRTTIHDARIPGGYSALTLADFVVEKQRTNTSVLVIMNTKKAAKNLYAALKRRYPSCSLFYYLSTALCPAHRRAKLEQLDEDLEDRRPVICVSTQLIEAGIDISFDCVVRSLAGLDSIAQAAGRCNRHGEDACRDVFIINSSEENLSHLPEIRRGQLQTERVLREYAEDPGQFDHDLLSPKALARYYLYYYEVQKKEMQYPVSKRNSEFATDVTLFDLLSLNKTGVTAYANRFGHRPGYPFCQAFASSGGQFAVIDQDTVSVLVPFERGKEVIEDLAKTSHLPATAELLKGAQQFSVNLFKSEVLSMDNGIYPIGDTGVLALADMYYSSEYGITPLPDTEPVIL